MTTYADKALRCVACSADFVFSAKEQEFHAAKGFTNEPRRCLACRQARRGLGPGGDAGHRVPGGRAVRRRAGRPRRSAGRRPELQRGLFRLRRRGDASLRAGGQPPDAVRRLLR
jgi:hypothetical protein